MTSADLERPPPFVLPSLGSAAASRRLHSIGADGRGEHAEDNPWVHMQLQDPFAAAAESPATATGSGGGDDAAAGSVEDLQQQQQTRPEDVIKAFSAAKVCTHGMACYCPAVMGRAAWHGQDHGYCWAHTTQLHACCA